MKPEDILDAIGNVDDICIKKAKEKNKSRKNFWISAGVLAACLTLAVGIPAISKTGPDTPKEPVIGTPDTQSPGPRNPDVENSDSQNAQYAFSYIRVYFNFDDKSKIAPRQNTLENQEMANVMEYMESILTGREGISYSNGEWNHDVQKKDIVINCLDEEYKLQAEYLLTNNILFDYQTNTEYILTKDEVKQLKDLLGL